MVGGEVLTSNVKEHVEMVEWSKRPLFRRTNKKLGAMSWLAWPPSLTKPPRSEGSSLGALGLALGNSLFGLQIQVRPNVKAECDKARTILAACCQKKQ